MRIEVFFVGSGTTTVKRMGWGRYDKLFTARVGRTISV